MTALKPKNPFNHWLLQVGKPKRTFSARLGASKEAAIAKGEHRDAHCRQLPLWRDRVRGCAVFSDSPAFQPDGKWDGTSRRYAVNARLFDGFDAAEAPVTVIDGKNLW
jgi:hypothetical protein